MYIPSMVGTFNQGSTCQQPILFIDDIDMLPLHVPSDTDTQTEKPPNSDIAALISSSNLKTGTVLYSFNAESNLELSLQVSSAPSSPSPPNPN